MPESGEGSFLDALMQHIVEDLVMIPKLQVERAVGPILGMFIAEVLSIKFDGKVEVICPEFPLRKTQAEGQRSNQSTNIDWLLYDRARDQLVLVELKTTDTTYSREQEDIYRKVIKTIQEFGLTSLLRDIEAIAPASREWGKYQKVRSLVLKHECYRCCRKAMLVYVAPECVKNRVFHPTDNQVLWLSFHELPEETSRFPDQWRIVRRWLVRLDGITRQFRNGMPEEGGCRNFKDTCRFEELIHRCRAEPDGIVVGFEGGTTNLRAATLDQLKGRSSYKWDYSETGTGRKDDRNWVPGRIFLEIIGELQGDLPSHKR